MNTNFQPVLEALAAWLAGTTILPFTADASGSAVLTGVSSFTNLFPGLPVFGPGVPDGTLVEALDAGAGTLTLTAAVPAVTGGAFTAGFLSWRRRLAHWGQVTSQPAGFVRRIGTSDDYDSLSVWSKTTLRCEIWIYYNAGADTDVIPDDGLAWLEQLVRAALGPDDDERFTLGGLVFWCRIQGDGDSAPGDQGGQAISRIPLLITLP